MKYSTPLFNSPFAKLPKGHFQLQLKAWCGAQATTWSSHVSPRLSHGRGQSRLSFAHLLPRVVHPSFLPFPPWGLCCLQAVQGGESLTRHLSTRCLARRSQPGPLHASAQQRNADARSKPPHTLAHPPGFVPGCSPGSCVTPSPDPAQTLQLWKLPSSCSRS